MVMRVSDVDAPPVKRISCRVKRKGNGEIYFPFIPHEIRDTNHEIRVLFLLRLGRPKFVADLRELLRFKVWDIVQTSVNRLHFVF